MEKKDIVVGKTIANINPSITLLLLAPPPSSPVLPEDDEPFLSLSSAAIIVPTLINMTPKIQKTHAIDLILFAGITDQYTPNKYTKPH